MPNVDALLQHRETSRALTVFARVGFAAKGLVYAVLGALSLLYVFGQRGGKLTDTQGAVARLGSQPFGNVLLWLTAIGLACYALWNLARVVFNLEHRRRNAKGVGKSLGDLFSAFTHGALAVYAAQGAYGGTQSGENGTESWAARALSMPLGELVLGIAGLIAIGFGVHQLRKAIKNEPEGQLAHERMSARAERVCTALGRLGQGARGLVFPVIGISLVTAAVRARPSEASDMGEALGELSRAPFGLVLLGFVALGLFAYGLYQAVLARYGVLPTER